MKIINGYQIKDLEFVEGTDQTHGRYEFLCHLMHPQNGDTYDIDGHVIVQPVNSREDDDWQWDIPDVLRHHWEELQAYLEEEFLTWRHKQIKDDSISERFDQLVSDVEDELKSLIVEKGKPSKHIGNEKALAVSVFGYEELCYINNELTFLDEHGHHYSLYADCDLHDLVEIIKLN